MKSPEFQLFLHKKLGEPTACGVRVSSTPCYCRAHESCGTLYALLTSCCCRAHESCGTLYALLRRSLFPLSSLKVQMNCTPGVPDVVKPICKLFNYHDIMRMQLQAVGGGGQTKYRVGRKLKKTTTKVVLSMNSVLMKA